MASHLIEVSFKGNRREFFLWDKDRIPDKNTAVIVEADRGEDLGHVHSTGDAALHRSKGTPHGNGGATPQRKARRVATKDDLKRHSDLRAQDEDARRTAMERVRANALQMKVSDAEWQWDRKKLTFYFTADRRVDFRTLVRELAAAFRTRIELKQIGVRDEARRLDGIGRCGRQYCSAAWLPDLRPVSLGVAKDQRLSLNPTQISGACGRLMCSLRYEHEFYVQARRRFPKEGKSVRTATGEEKVVSNDIFRERVLLRNGEGEMRTIPLAQLLEESAAAGGTIVPAVSARRRTPDERMDEPADESPDETADEGPDAMTEEAAEDFAEELPAASIGVSSVPPTGVSTTPSPDRSSRPDGRPHRRRGRRGGRRNRGGRRDGPGGDAPNDSGGKAPQ